MISAEQLKMGIGIQPEWRSFFTREAGFNEDDRVIYAALSFRFSNKELFEAAI